ncbi:MAG: permease-like cell division protein FtsX [Congregibacter sp.]
MLQNPLASLMTWLVIGIAIAMPTGLWLVLDNLSQFADRMDSPGQFSVFLGDEVESEDAKALALELSRRDNVSDCVFLDRDQALAEFIERTDMGDLAASLSENPLPHVLLLTPQIQDPALLRNLRESLENNAQIQEVVADTQWLERLRSLMQLGRRAVQLLAGLLLAAVVLILGNTIRLAIESRREDIVIVKLVGGSDAFVRRPLLYTGLWYGLGGGVVASLLIAGCTWFLLPPVRSLAVAYQSSFVAHGLGFVDSLQLVLLGTLLGLLGAWLAVARHLRYIEPD